MIHHWKIIFIIRNTTYHFLNFQTMHSIEVAMAKWTFTPVFKRIFILDRIEYRILFALAKLTESNNEYYSCCEIYSNNIRIVQDIRIFEYFRIIFNAKMKDLLKYQKTLCFVKMPSVLTIIRPKLNYHSFCFLLNKYLFK